jgi:hypothetical protein
MREERWVPTVGMREQWANRRNRVVMMREHVNGSTYLFLEMGRGD